jgi:hypothetical protein
MQTAADIILTPAICIAQWQGDENILPSNVDVDVLAIDQGARVDPSYTHVIDIPARAACWIRWTNGGKGRPSYRSCDYADLYLTSENVELLYKMNIKEHRDGTSSASYGFTSTL